MGDLISRQAAVDAIDEISREVDDGDGFDYAKWREYFCELPSELSTNLAEVGTDCISRQAAISAICNACGKIDCDKMDKCEKLQLPPANCSEFPNNSDTISRQAAIDLLKQMRKDGDMIPWEGKDVFARIRKLPPAQPEPKRGRWIYKTDLITAPTGYWECSECKEGRLLYEENFCPHCGADMKGEDNETD